MTVLFTVLLCSAMLLLLKPPLDAASRLRTATGKRKNAPGVRRGLVLPWGKAAGRSAALTRGPGLTLVVQQLAALLRGGRTPGRLWDELWTVYGDGGNGRFQERAPVSGAMLSEGSAAVLSSARAAAATGAPVSESIRRAVSTAFQPRDREARTWLELAACFDIAEASGCALADMLTRFAAQLEAEDDADAARQTALAGPKATVRLLTWLPLMGLGLGAALGVDPLATLLGTPLGLAALFGGVVLTVTGRAWSARLVSAAAGA
ncbi:hypothetical protein NMQ03_17560 [Arthrobacter sp. DNA4]|uniref:type II secretion system F family protein n=1 Tax=Arthrobacter sp. DNA4 TaxID=2963432 RepID=UPI0020CF07EB|nr:hypothetical protein [Arthrobacter sp. DNA4]UTT68995.1 hypothetical protein NMQ03_17560 [Arthrobacter sp. DNA4]